MFAHQASSNSITHGNGCYTSVPAKPLSQDTLENQCSDASELSIPISRVSSRRCMWLIAVASMLLAAFCYQAVTASNHGEITRHARIEDFTLLADVQQWPNTDYAVLPACPDDGGVCICNRTNKPFVPKSAQRVICQSWVFQIGDVMVFGQPQFHFRLAKYFSAWVESAVQNSDAVHVGIVISVPPPGIRQTPRNVIIAEVLGTPIGNVKSTLHFAVMRYQWGSFYIRRVDPMRFSNFHSVGRLSRMQSWVASNMNKPFDSEMVNVVTRSDPALTKGRYFPIPLSCADEKRALKMYHKGGLSQWMCSQFIAWTLAFAGGLNIDYGTSTPSCDVPAWKISNLQMVPADLLDDPYQIYESNAWHMPCGHDGCFVGLPMSVPYFQVQNTDGTYWATDYQKEAVEFPAAR